MKNKIMTSGFVALTLAASVSFTSLSHAMSMDVGGGSPLGAIQGMLDMELYQNASQDLKKILKMDPNNADAWNLLGFAYRKMGQLDLSWDAYERALTLDPDHMGANEYLGELYIAQGNMEQAESQLHKLMVLCPTGCDAFDNLKKAIKAAQ